MKIFTSTAGQGYLKPQVLLQPAEPRYTLHIDSSKPQQTIQGFGGAFTEAAAFNFSKMSKETQDKLLSLYFDPIEGLRYNLGRVAINSCDFALGNYTYVTEGDVSLSSFSIEHEKEWVIPMIKQAEKVAKRPISILASPWSPPAWMKTNNEMNHGGKLIEEYYPVWANYFVRFIEAMRQEGISINAVTVQNEPAAVQTWDSCIYTPEEEGRFALDFLGPAIEQSNHPDVDIYIWDHNRDVIVERVKPILEDPRASKYIHGVAFHWYVSEEFSNLSKVKSLFPQTHLIFTEGCIEGGTKVGEFSSGERYMRNMIGDFSNGCEGYIDWNLMLDMQGGPNHVGNYCDAPILVDETQDLFHVNSSYYAIGHFSKFVEEGAKHITTSTNHPFVKEVAFQNPNGDIVIILQNESDNETSISLVNKQHSTSLNMPAHSFSTVIMEVDHV